MSSATYATEAEFDALRDAGDLIPRHVYVVDDQYAWSPDGIGCFWYESLDELEAQHG